MGTNLRRKISLLLSGILLCQGLGAIPAPKGLVRLSQPDGSTIQAYLSGDEFARIATDQMGRAIVQGDDGFYRYAFFTSDGRRYPTAYRVGSDTPTDVLSSSRVIPYTEIRRSGAQRREALYRSMQKSHSVRPASVSTKSESVKQRKCIIIPAAFKDLSFEKSRDDIYRAFTEEGYSDSGASGSVKQYLDAQLSGEYSFTFDIAPVITLSKKQAYYGANGDSGTDSKATEAIAEACRLAHEAGVDFSRYDGDGDNYVDNVFVIVAGFDEATGGGEDCIWSHYYRLSAVGESFTLDGKIIDGYTVSTEYEKDRSGETLGGAIAIYAHEYSHSLGLFDMYDTDNGQSEGWGNGLFHYTALMDGGTYNNNCHTPPHYNAIDYDTIGAGQCETMTNGEYTLEPISTSRRYLRLEGSTSGEYYLFECRDASSGWDSYIGGSGLLVYHIDKSDNDALYSEYHGQNISAAKRWSYNVINANPGHECAMLVSANPSLKTYTDGGQYIVSDISSAFFPYSSHTSFTADTDPSFTFWSGERSQMAITDIKRDGVNVKFTVAATAGIVIPEVNFTKADIFQDTAILQWSPSDESFSGTAYVIYGESSGKLDTLAVSPYQSGCYALRLEGLKSSTAYKFIVKFGMYGVYGKEATSNFTTKSYYSGSYPFIYIGEDGRATDGSFSQGAQLPLVVYNCPGGSSVKWYLGSEQVYPSSSGYYPLTKNGNLKAVITREDGTLDVIVKKITI